MLMRVTRGFFQTVLLKQQFLFCTAASSTTINEQSKQILKENQNDKVRCYNCGKTGHFGNQCSRKKRCFRCNKLGHTAANCKQQIQQSAQSQNKIQVNASVVQSQTPLNLRCFNCGEKGHFSKNCPSEKVCYKCSKKGHLASACPQKSQMKCLNCGKTGHFAINCTEEKVAKVQKAKVSKKNQGQNVSNEQKSKVQEGGAA